MKHNKIINKCALSNFRFFMIASVILAFLGGLIFCVQEDKIKQKDVAVSISSTGEMNEFSKFYNITLLGVKVDGIFYPAQDIFEGDWLNGEDGKLLYNWECEKESELVGMIPDGYDQEIIFEGNKWKGDVIVSYKETSVKISTYINGESQEIAFRVSDIQFDLINCLGIFLVLFVILIFVYGLCCVMFFNQRGVLQGISKKVFIKKMFGIISGLVVTAIVSSASMNPFWIYISIVGALPLYFYLFFVLNKKKSPFSQIEMIIFLLSMIGVVWNRWTYVYNFFSEIPLLQVPCVIVIFLLMMPAALYLEKIVFFHVSSRVKKFIREMDKFEKNYIIVANIILVVLLVLLYSHTSAFSNGLILNEDGTMQRQYADVIYGFDHSWIQDYYPTMDIHIFNIKHPFIYVFFFVPGCIGILLDKMISPIFPQIYGLFCAWICAQCMFISALIMKRLSKNKEIAIIYSMTYFFLLLCLGGEQYQISILLILMAIYEFIDKGKADDGVMLAMSGATLTSGHLVPVLIDYKSIKQYIGELIRYCMLFFGVCCMFGTSYMLSYENLGVTLQPFQEKYGFGEKFKVFTNFVTWNFVSPNAYEKMTGTGNPVYTATLPQDVSWLGLIIAGVCVFVVAYSLCREKDDKLTRVASFSFLFSIILLVGMGWAVGEAWLFSILFSWCYILLIHKFIEKFIKVDSVKSIIYKVTIAVLLMNNMEELGDLFEFCVNIYNGL